MIETAIEITGIVSSVIAVGGVLLNNYRLRVCFIAWIVSNSMTLAVHVAVGVWSLAARDAVFLVLAIHGWFAWGRSKV